MRTGIRAWPRAALRVLAALVTGTVALVLLLVLLAGVALVPVFGLGLPVLAGALQATRWLAALHRREAARVLGHPVPAAPYASQPVPTPAGLRAGFRDRQNARDVAWLGAHGVATSVLGGFGFGADEAVAALLQADSGWVAAPTLAVLAVVYWVVPGAEWGLALLAARLLGAPGSDLATRVEQLTESRAATVDAQAAELRRIERDLHDGAQARLAAVGMTLGLAAQVVRTDPDQAERLIEEGRAHARRALAELRDLVRGIHPPVLADRGLPGGLEAAALMCPVPVDVAVDLPGRPDPPVESAVYFAAAEALANVGRHSGATRAWLRATESGGVLRLVVGDDGTGGADPRRGTGLRGIQRRLAAFDGTVTVHSPAGGPTEIVLEVPCASSSPRTPSSSVTA